MLTFTRAQVTFWCITMLQRMHTLPTQTLCWVSLPNQPTKFASRDVRLPGKDHNSPEIFAFGTPYLDIYDTLRGKDEDFFRRNNLLGLVARNASIKPAPQRFQDIGGAEVAGFDVVLCFDSRVFYLVVEGTTCSDYAKTVTIS